MQFRSLSLKVALIGGAIVALIVGLGAVWLNETISRIVAEQTAQLEEQTIANEAGVARQRLGMAATGTKDLASTFEMLRAKGIGDRAVYDAVLRASAERTPEFLGTWAGWEPNALDGRDRDFVGKPDTDQTGRFLAYWNRTTGTVKRDVLTGYETDPYYVSPQKLNRPVLIEPYFYPVAGGSHLIMSLGMPLRLDQRIVGTIGVDVDLTTLYGSLDAEKPFGTGYLVLVSNDGQTIVHPKAEAIGKPLAQNDPIAAEAARQAVERQAIARVDGIGADGRPWRFVAAPIRIDEARETWAAVAAIPTATLEAAAEKVRTTMEIVGAACIVVLGSMLFVLLRLLMGTPLRGLGRTLDLMAAGDFDREVREARRSDEIGAIGRAVERLREGLKERARATAEREAMLRSERDIERRETTLRLANQFEADVGGVVDLVSTAAIRLQETATVLTSLASNASTQSEFVHSAAVEASATAAAVAASADQLGGSVRQVGERVAQSSVQSREAVSEAEASAAVMEELSRAAGQIGDIVKLISAIAHQTNLLALNATIEANRAGDAGQGFAVVATEVKVLSNQTASATAAITQQIAAITQSTGRAVATIDTIGRRIHTISEATETVAEMVRQQGEATLEIVGSVRQVSAGTNDVTGSITAVAEAAHNTGDTAHKVLEAASDLTRQSDHLRGVVKAFLTSVRAA